MNPVSIITCTVGIIGTTTAGTTTTSMETDGANANINNVTDVDLKAV